MNKWMKKLTAALCAAVLMCGMAVTAYAGGGEEWDGLDPVEPLPTEAVDPGEGFTENGNLVTRDLLHDKATNKQFITVQTSGGNTFYIVILKGSSPITITSLPLPVWMASAGTASGATSL